MIRYPTSREQAEQYRYGQWAGNEKGNAYSSSRCAYEVWPERGIPYQCQFSSGYGPGNLYCKIHSKKIKRAQGEQSA